MKISTKLVAIIGLICCLAVSSLPAEEQEFIFDTVPFIEMFFSEGEEETFRGAAVYTIQADNHEPQKAAFALGRGTVNAYMVINAKQIENIDITLNGIIEKGIHASVDEHVAPIVSDIMRVAMEQDFEQAAMMIQMLVDNIQVHLYNDGKYDLLTAFQLGFWTELVDRFVYFMNYDYKPEMTHHLIQQGFMERLLQNVDFLSSSEQFDAGHLDGIRDNLSQMNEFMQSAGREIGEQEMRTLTGITDIIRDNMN